EDGIRDLIVTGVQTCALPIFRSERLNKVSRFVCIYVAESDLHGKVFAKLLNDFAVGILQYGKQRCINRTVFLIWLWRESQSLKGGFQRHHVLDFGSMIIEPLCRSLKGHIKGRRGGIQGIQ